MKIDTPAEHLGKFLMDMDINPQEDIFRIHSNEPREIKDIVIEAVNRLMPGTKIEVSAFEVGDYIYHDMVFERKSFDFGNYQMVKQQCIEMKLNFPRVHLVIDTNLDDIEQELFEHNPTRADSLNGFIASLVEIGVVPLFCSNPEHMAEIMVKRCIKGTDMKDRIYIEPIRPQVSDKDEVLHIVKSISGISTERGKKLLMKFKNVNGIACASIEDLTSIDGIGPKTAKSIYESFRKEWIEDGQT